MEDLWHADLKLWFPEGLETANLSLLRIIPSRGEYWDTKTGKVAAATRALRVAFDNVVKGDSKSLGDALSGKENHGKVDFTDRGH